MRQHNCEDLKLAMNKELKDQIANSNFIVLSSFTYGIANETQM